MHMSVHMHIHVHNHVLTHVHAYTVATVHRCMCINTWIYMHVHEHTHVHTEICIYQPFQLRHIKGAALTFVRLV